MGHKDRSFESELTEEAEGYGCTDGAPPFRQPPDEADFVGMAILAIRRPRGFSRQRPFLLF
jgi:hypothetical protein